MVFKVGKKLSNSYLALKSRYYVQSIIIIQISLALELKF
jgi:hypothetical protein